MDNSSGGLAWANDEFDLLRRPTTFTSMVSPDLTPGIVSSFGVASKRPDLDPGFVQLTFDSVTASNKSFIIEISDGSNHIMDYIDVSDNFAEDEDLS